jgi:magnesium transporter
MLPSFKPKVERRGDVLYVILHFPVIHNAHQKHEQEIDFLIGKDFLITTRFVTVDPLHSFAKAFEADSIIRSPSSTHGGHLFVLMTRNLYTALLAECDTLEHRLRDVEEHIFAGEEKRMVARLSHIGRLIHDFRQSFAAHGEMLASFEPVSMRFFGPEFAYYVHDLQGASERIVRRLGNLRDSLTELRETNNSLLSTKQNEIMKTLTVLAFVFFPITFVGQLFGMSSPYIPLMGTPWGFWAVLCGMLAIAAGCFVYFKSKGWL